MKLLTARISIVLFAFLLVFIGVYVYIKQSGIKENMKVPENSIKISEHLYLSPAQIVNQSTYKIYLIDTKKNKKTLLHSSDIPIGIHLFDGKVPAFTTDNGQKLLVLYEYTDIQEGNTTRKYNEKGFVYGIFDGKKKLLYETENIFEAAAIENGKLIVYEKIFIDDMNMFPKHYKPYIRVKKVYQNGKFKEVERTEVMPTENAS